MKMSTFQSVFKACALAAPLLLLAQCTEGPSTPAAPPDTKVCLDYGDPERTFALVHPLPGELLRGACCEQIAWSVQNACGEWVARVEGWFDGTYHDLGARKGVSYVNWITPRDGCGCARLRVTVTDDLGLIGTKEVQVPVLRAHPNPPPIERD